MNLRLYTQADTLAIIQLFRNTVHTVCTADYSSEQLDAWAPKHPDYEKWQRSLSANYCMVAEENGVITGFADMAKTGYLDRLYVHKDYQRKGVAAALLSAMMDYAENCNVDTVTTYASKTARPFFEKQGFTVEYENTVVRDGIELTNYKMNCKIKEHK